MRTTGCLQTTNQIILKTLSSGHWALVSGNWDHISPLLTHSSGPVSLWRLSLEFLNLYMDRYFWNLPELALVTFKGLWLALSSLTKLSGKTPVLPSSVPFHQPGSSSCLATTVTTCTNHSSHGPMRDEDCGHVTRSPPIRAHLAGQEVQLVGVDRLVGEQDLAPLRVWIVTWERPGGAAAHSTLTCFHILRLLLVL